MELKHPDLRRWSGLRPAARATVPGTSRLGLARNGWATTSPIRDVFCRAFIAAGLPYCNPHSLRDMLVHHAMKLNLSPEEMKAWSQNLGHADVLTTFSSYGQVPTHRQGELIRAGGKAAPADEIDPAYVAKVMAAIRQAGGGGMS
jgi:integrase